MSAQARLPLTIAEAVDAVLTGMPDEAKGELAEMTHDQLPMLHFGIGLWIRNNLGLWGGNAALRRAAGEDPDEASMVIIEALWKRLRSERSGGSLQT